jgi:hypothetical protein
MLSAEDAAKIAQESTKPFLPEATKLKLSELVRKAASQGKMSLSITVNRPYLSLFTGQDPKYFIGDEEIVGDILEIKNFLVAHGYIFITPEGLEHEHKEYTFKW